MPFDFDKLVNAVVHSANTVEDLNSGPTTSNLFPKICKYFNARKKKEIKLLRTNLDFLWKGNIRNFSGIVTDKILCKSFNTSITLTPDRRSEDPDYNPIIDHNQAGERRPDVAEESRKKFLRCIGSIKIKTSEITKRGKVSSDKLHYKLRSKFPSPKIKITCCITFNGFKTSKNPKTPSKFWDYAYCRQPKCQCAYKVIGHEKGKYTQIYVYVIGSSVPQHTLPLNYQLRGRRRVKTKKRLRHEMPFRVHARQYKKIDTQLAKEHKNYKFTHSLRVFQTARCEALGCNDLDSDDTLDIVKKLISDPSHEHSFIRKFISPFTIYLGCIEQIEFLRNNPGLVFYFDATGSIIQKPYAESKRIYLYAGVVGKLNKIMPLLHMITNDQRATTIRDMLRDFKETCQKAGINWPPFEAVVVDWSWAGINAIMSAWNDTDVSKYLEAASQGSTDNYLTVHLCYGHFMKMISRFLRNHGVDGVIKRIIMEGIAILCHCTSLDELKLKVTDFATILLSKKKNQTMLRAVKSLIGDTVISTETVAGENDSGNSNMVEEKYDSGNSNMEEEEHDCGNSNMEEEEYDRGNANIKKEENGSGNVDMEEKKNDVAKSQADETNRGAAYSTSPFFAEFNTLLRGLVTSINNDCDDALDDNAYRCEVFIKYLIKKLLPYAPLWTGMLIKNKTRRHYTNATAENSFKILKESLCEKHIQFKAGRIIDILHDHAVLTAKQLELDPSSQHIKKRRRIEMGDQSGAGHLNASPSGIKPPIPKIRDQKTYSDGEESVIYSDGGPQSSEKPSKNKRRRKQGRKIINAPGNMESSEYWSRGRQMGNVSETYENSSTLKKIGAVNDDPTAMESCTDNVIREESIHYNPNGTVANKDYYFAPDEKRDYLVGVVAKSPVERDNYRILRGEDYNTLYGKRWISNMAIDYVFSYTTFDTANSERFAYVAGEVASKYVGVGESRMCDEFKMKCITDWIGRDGILLPMNVYDQHFILMYVDLRSKVTYLLDPATKTGRHYHAKCHENWMKMWQLVFGTAGNFTKGSCRYPYKADGYNCGIFVIHYIQEILRNGYLNIGPVNPDKLRLSLQHDCIVKSADVRERCLRCGCGETRRLETWVSCDCCKKWAHLSCLHYLKKTREEIECSTYIYTCDLCAKWIHSQ